MKLDRREFLLMASVSAAALGRPAWGQDEGPFMPHPGLEITTAFTNSFGPDAESWITMTAVSPEAIEVGYRSARGVVASRQILQADRAGASTLVLGYASRMPHVIPNTTSLGLSSAQLRELRSTGQTAMSIIYDTALSRMSGRLTLVAQGIRMPVLVGGDSVEVPVLHAHGEFADGRHSAAGDLFILDNQNNPVLIQYSLSFSGEIQPRTEKITRVTAGASEQAKMEQALRTLKRYDLYGIHFDFDKASIQPQAVSLINDIAVTLKNNPTWTLRIVGHTDSIGDANYNLKLSGERAASVKTALVERGVAANRLETQGAGASDPKASNATLQGRALNRRVELIRTDR
jgi:outer membrane protein OmpA-like peptidoglycan-associated protein